MEKWNKWKCLRLICLSVASSLSFRLFFLGSIKAPLIILHNFISIYISPWRPPFTFSRFSVSRYVETLLWKTGKVSSDAVQEETYSIRGNVINAFISVLKQWSSLTQTRVIFHVNVPQGFIWNTHDSDGEIHRKCAIHFSEIVLYSSSNEVMHNVSDFLQHVTIQWPIIATLQACCDCKHIPMICGPCTALCSLIC